MGKLKMAFENEFEHDRTIDHESGAYLVYEGGVAAERGLHRFSFHWKGEKIPFYALDESEELPDHSFNKNFRWAFYQLGLPHHMQDQREEIADMIKQALEAHGFGYNRERYVDVIADYSPP